MWSNLAYYATLAGESLIGIFGIRLYEEPRYDILARLGDRVEIRSYAPRLAAEVDGAGAAPAGRDDAFRLLFAYIAGANTGPGGSGKLAMTVPVETRDGTKLAMTAPVQVTDTGAAFAMRFYLPAAVRAETAPQPTDPRVRLVTVPGETIATLRFSGSARDHAAEQAELLATLRPSRWQPSGTPYLLGYDPPFALPFLRRNEVAVAVARAP